MNTIYPTIVEHPPILELHYLITQLNGYVLGSAFVEEHSTL